ncbi:hypothetical protein UY3_10871 [Chelonia mydas]|uniref:Uncharacterized protein n=1 Tax=Chelonia mydas TaxID=8469 RepID=M7B4C2_CHEMY|nr:hypothetical protein UY3_10871 [Chelonia mydas]
MGEPPVRIGSIYTDALQLHSCRSISNEDKLFPYAAMQHKPCSDPMLTTQWLEYESIAPAAVTEKSPLYILSHYLAEVDVNFLSKRDSILEDPVILNWCAAVAVLESLAIWALVGVQTLGIRLWGEGRGSGLRQGVGVWEEVGVQAPGGGHLKQLLDAAACPCSGPCTDATPAAPIGCGSQPMGDAEPALEQGQHAEPTHRLLSSHIGYPYMSEPEGGHADASGSHAEPRQAANLPQPHCAADRTFNGPICSAD